MTLISTMILSAALVPCQDEIILPKQDPFEALLKEAKLVYEDIGGFYKLNYTVKEGKRKQVAYVRKNIEAYRSLKSREVFSIFYESETAPPQSLLTDLFSKRYSIGGMTLEKPSETQKFWRIRFRVDILDNLKATEVAERISIVAATGDALEESIDPTKDQQ